VSFSNSWDGLTYIDGYSQIANVKKLNSWGEPNWMHRDQRLENENLADTIQGYLALSDADIHEYCTVFFLPKTMSAQELVSKFHETFYRQTNRYERKINLKWRRGVVAFSHTEKIRNVG
jgi:hypothetical protein